MTQIRRNTADLFYGEVRQAGEGVGAGIDLIMWVNAELRMAESDAESGGEQGGGKDSARVERERRTVEHMIRLYCRGNHGSTGELCQECGSLMKYANQRLDHCPHKENKPTCLKCTVHCYNQEMRERIRGVMRYSGPRMLVRHPIMALRHIFDGRRK